MFENSFHYFFISYVPHFQACIAPVPVYNTKPEITKLFKVNTNTTKL